MTEKVKVWGHAEGHVAGVSDSGLLIVKLLENGEATHTGRFSNEVTLYLNPLGGMTHGEGTCTAANGDKYNWVSTIEGSKAKVTFTAGTGIYTGITGGFTADVISSDLSESGAAVVEYVGYGIATYCQGRNGVASSPRDTLTGPRGRARV